MKKFNVLEDVVMVNKSFDLSDGSVLRTLVSEFSDWYKHRVDYSQILNEVICAFENDGEANLESVISEVLFIVLSDTYVNKFSCYDNDSAESDLWEEYISQLGDDLIIVFSDLIDDLKRSFIKHYVYAHVKEVM